MLIKHTYKTYIKAAMAITIGAMITGCVSLGPPPPSANYPEKLQATPVAKALPQGVKIDADDHFDDKFDIDNALEGSNKIVIPGFRIRLVISDYAKASEDGSSHTNLAGTIRTTTSAVSNEMRVNLTGLNDQQLQAIADAAYADLVAQLQDAGREVVSAADMRATLGYHSIEFAAPSGDSIIIEGGSFNSGDNRAYLDIPATGLPLWYIDFFNNNNGKSFNFLSSELKATALYPVITINFVIMGSDDDGYFDFGSGVGAELGIRIVDVDYNATLAENAMGGDGGSYFLREGHDDPIIISGDFGSLKKSVGSTTGGMFQGISHKANYRADANPKKFSTLVLKGIQTSNKAFVDFTKEYRP